MARTHRAPVYARSGIVAASQPLAVSAGIEILQRGGSAIDAAIAVSAVLAVVEPGASHLGGDAFAIIHRASDRSNLALNGSGEAPHAATPESFASGIPEHGFKSATVPGLVSSWFAAHESYGVLPFGELLQAAIEYAENGFPANPGFARRAKHHHSIASGTEIFTEMGFSPEIKVGELVFQKNLAEALLTISEEGRSAFYEGWIAEALVAGSLGWFSLADLAAHRTRMVPPLSVKYRDFYIHGQPPPSQGMILMEELGIASRFELAELSEAQRIHILVEAKKLAFADRYRILGDPEHIDVNVDEILSDEFIAQRSSEIDLDRASTRTQEFPEGKDTTYFLVADRDGNAVSWIQSVFQGFGASWVIPGTGILMNNRLTGFSLDSRSPNLIAPGKRPAHTLNAWLATRNDGRLAHVGGTPGANIQVQTNLQLVVNAIDLKMNPQENAEAPRWQHLAAVGDSAAIETGAGVLQIEDRFPYEVSADLKERGHDVRELPAYGHGSAVQLLEVTEDGTYIAGSDPRCEGLALGI